MAKISDEEKKKNTANFNAWRQQNSVLSPNTIQFGVQKEEEEPATGLASALMQAQKAAEAQKQAKAQQVIANAVQNYTPPKVSNADVAKHSGESIVNDLLSALKQTGQTMLQGSFEDTARYNASRTGNDMWLNQDTSKNDALADYWAQKRLETAKHAAEKQSAINQKYNAQNFSPTQQFVGKGARVTGEILPALIPGAGTVYLANLGYGSAANQAINDGATLEQATEYGAAEAAKEVIIEKTFGGLKGMKALINPAKVTDNIANPLLRTGADLALRSAGEGAEEVVSTYASPYLQRAIYNPDAENASKEELIESFLLGALGSGVINVGATGASKVADAVQSGQTNAVDRQNQRMDEALFGDTSKIQQQLKQNQQKNAQKMGDAIQNAQNTPEQAQDTGMTNTLPRPEKVAQNQSSQAVFEQNAGKNIQNRNTNDITPKLEDARPKVTLEMSERNFDNVADKNVKAYQQENPEIKPFQQETAEKLLFDLQMGEKGRREVGIDAETRNVTTMHGIKRNQSEPINRMLNDGLSYNKIEDGLNRIIEDEGSENTPNAKRVELYVHDAMRDGYNSIVDGRVSGNRNYAISNMSMEELEAETQRLTESLSAVTDEEQFAQIESQLDAIDKRMNLLKKDITPKLERAKKPEPDYSELDAAAERRNNLKKEIESGHWYENDGAAYNSVNRNGMTIDEYNQKSRDLRTQYEQAQAEFERLVNEAPNPTAEESSTIYGEDFDVNELPEEERRFYSELNQKFGGTAKLSKKLPDDVNGVFHNGEVILNANKLSEPDTIRYAMIHEFGHKMKGTAEYDAIQEMALKYFRSIADDPDVTDLDLVDYIKGTRQGTDYEIQSEVEAYDELTTMFMEMAFDDVTTIDKICVEQPSLAQRILEFIEQKIHDYNAKKGLSKLEKQQYDMLAKTRRLYVQGLRKTNQKDAKKKSGGLFTNDSVQSDSKEIRYSINSVRHDINEGKMRSDLINHGLMTEQEADAFIANLTDLADHIESFQSTFLDMFEPYGKEGRATLPYKDNSDPLYKVSLDFSTLCKKRIITQAMIERLQVAKGRALSAEEQIAIRDYLKELKQENDKIEVACAMCYVEAARLRTPKYINEFIDNPVKIVQKYLGTKNEENKAAIEAAGNAKLKELGYAEGTKLKAVKTNSMEDWKAVKGARDAVKDSYKATSPEEIAILDFLENEFEPRMVLTASGMMELKQKQPVVYTALNAFLAGKSKAKALQTGEPYYYGDASTVGDELIDQMNAENGIRHNSWSDFEITHLLDLLVAVTELSVRKAKMHYYSKVPAEFYVMKDTGAIGNISLIPKGQTGFDSNGNLDFDPVEGVPYEEAMKIREDCSRSAGTTAIGISDAHIKALLESDVIDYVIPYHTSGLNKTLRSMVGINGWTDYQNYQNEKNAKGKNAENALNFSDWFHPTQKDIETKTGIQIMREAQAEYLRLCKERGITPKFSNTKDGTDFSKHENYWKLLIDRKMIDNDGNIIIQQEVKPNFDFDYMKKLVNEEYEKSPESSIEEGIRAVENLGDEELNARVDRLKSQKNLDTRLSTGSSRYQQRVNEIKNIKHKREVSKVYSNTIKNSTLFTEVEKNIELNASEYEYDVKSEKESLHRAVERLENDHAGTSKELMHKKMYTGEDLDAAMFLLRESIESARETGDYNHAKAWLKKIKEAGTEAGRMIQAYAKYSRTTAEGIAVQAERYVQQAEDNLKAGHAKGKIAGKEIGKDKDSRKWQKVEGEAKKAQKAVEDAEAMASKSAQKELEMRVKAYKAKHYKTNPNPKSKAEPDFADKLYKKVLEGTNMELEEKGAITGKQIVDELYQKLKENGMPDYRGQREKRNYTSLEYLKDAVQRKEEYAEVFEKTQEYMKAEYGNDPEVLQLIKDAMNGNFSNLKLDSVYSKKTVEKAVKETAELFDIDFKEIIKQSKGDKDEAAQVIVNHIMQFTDVPDADAKKLADDVVNAYCNELKRMTDQRLKQLFPELVQPQLEKASKKKTSWFDDIMELINLGAYENQDIVDIIKQKNNLPVLTNADIETIYSEVEKANQYKKYSYEWKSHMAKAQQVAADKMPQSMKNKATHLKRIMMMSNTRTHVRNLGGNMPMVGTEMISNAIAAPIDKRLSEKRGTGRTISANPEIGAFAQGFAKGFGETVSDIKQGVNTYRMGEESTTQYEMPRGRTFANAFLDGIDKAVNYGLMFGDRPFFEGHYNKRMAELDRLGYDVTSDEAKADAYAHAVDMVFQNDSDMSKGASGIREALNNFLTIGNTFALGDFIIPFVQTPANIADKLLDYTPVGLARVVSQIGRSNTEAFDQRLFSQRLGRSLTGMGILTVAYVLASAGIITGSSDDDPEKRRAMELSGWRPYSIKLGDTYHDYSWTGPVGMLLAIGADMYQEGQSVDDLTDLVAVAGAGIKGGVNCFFNMSFFESLTDFFGGYGDPASNMGSAVLDFPTQFAPALTNAVNKTIDPYQRETYDPNPIKQSINKVAAKLPLASQTLPKKLNVYGEEMMQNQGRNVIQRTAENMLYPSTVGQEKSHKVNDELLRLNEATGKESQFFAYPDKKQTFGSETITLSSDEWLDFIERSNGYASRQIENLIASSFYKEMDDEDKIKTISTIKEYANYKAKKSLASEYGISYKGASDMIKMDRAVKAMNGNLVYYMKMKADTAEIKANTSDDKAEVKKYLKQLKDGGTLTEEQWWYMRYDLVGLNDTERRACPYAWIRNM